jgi:hypothetical protein
MIPGYELGVVKADNDLILLKLRNENVVLVGVEPVGV